MAGERKADYQRWRENEFRADIHVMSMTPVQRWIYRTLCQSAWVESTRPYLPVDDENLWRMAGCESLEQWNANKAPVLEMFERIEVNGEQRFSQKRITEDWAFLQGYTQDQSERGKRGSASRWKPFDTRTDSDGNANATETDANGLAKDNKVGIGIGQVGIDSIGRDSAVALAPPRFAFKGRKLQLTEIDHETLKAKFPEFHELELRRQYEKMDAWAVKAKKSDKTDWARFAFNWLNDEEPLKRGAAPAQPAAYPYFEAIAAH